MLLEIRDLRERKAQTPGVITQGLFVVGEENLHNLYPVFVLLVNDLSVGKFGSAIGVPGGVENQPHGSSTQGLEVDFLAVNVDGREALGRLANFWSRSGGVRNFDRSGCARGGRTFYLSFGGGVVAWR